MVDIYLMKKCAENFRDEREPKNSISFDDYWAELGRKQAIEELHMQIKETIEYFEGYKHGTKDERSYFDTIGAIMSQLYNIEGTLASDLAESEERCDSYED